MHRINIVFVIIALRNDQIEEECLFYFVSRGEIDLDIGGTFGLRAAQPWGRGLERAHTWKVRPAQASTGKKKKHLIYSTLVRISSNIQVSSGSKRILLTDWHLDCNSNMSSRNKKQHTSFEF